MKITIQAPWEINTYLAAVIKEKIEKLNTFHPRLLHAEVFLKKGNHTGIADKQLEVRLKAPGEEYFAQDFADTFEKAVVGTAHKLKAQLVKKREKLQEKHPR